MFENQNCTKCIAILMTTYNGENYILEQLESIVAQTYQDYICYIHDDVSTDQTVDILEKFCLMHPDKFVFLGSHKCGGSRQNFMYMLRLVRARHIMFCDQDDVWFSDKIEKTFMKMLEIEDQKGESVPICVYSDVKVVDSKLNILKDYYWGSRGEENKTQELLKQNIVRGCTMMINAALQEKMLEAQNPDNIYMHDWWGALICSLLGELVYIREPLMLYRQHNDNVIGAHKRVGLLHKFRNILSFNNFSIEKKSWIKRPRVLAKELINIIPPNNSQYVFLDELANISFKSKWSRIKFYLKNDMINRRGNILFQLIYI